MTDPVMKPQRIVVKIGSTLITNHGAGVDHELIAEWVRQIASLCREGHQLILVSSGAIAEGMQRLGWKTRPHEINQLQAAAAIGQMGLVQVYESAFREHGLQTAQILLTHDDLADRTRYLNARSTLTTLLDLGAVPVINENDTVVTDEIKFGDNDTLAALVANLVEADRLIILTDQQGLFSADPRKDAAATLIAKASAGDQKLEAMAGGAGSALGRGGMLTKVLAAKKAALSGTSTTIAHGRETDVLLRLMKGEAIGSHLVANTLSLQARKTWLAGHLKNRRQFYTGCRCGCGTQDRRQELTRHRCACGGWSVRARRHRPLPGSIRSRNRPWPQPLLGSGNAQDRRQTYCRN